MKNLCYVSCLTLVLSGCALTSRSEAIRVRYFTPEDTAHATTQASEPRALELRLGRVEASEYLSEDIAFRNGQHELEYYEDQRWTEKPQEYLRRALARALFQERGITRAYSGAALTLDVELVAFEELRYGGEPKVRFKAIASLHDERRSIFEQTFLVERPLRDNAGGPEHTGATASALAQAMRAAVSGMCERVIASLTAQNATLDATAQAHASENASAPH